MKLRFDKYIWFVRLTKTRKEAIELIKLGRIKLNSFEVKASKEVSVSDVIIVKKHNALFTFKIITIPERRLGPKLVSDYIEDITPENEKIKLQEYLNAQKEYRQFGTGKPTKKQRRELTHLKSN
jgi:ribosome-associated heat shock protein Hsp15